MLEHFRTYGWVRISAAFSAGDAAVMCDVIWAALAKVGIRRDFNLDDASAGKSATLKGRAGFSRYWERCRS